ncbi:MAG: hypothetical protein KQJ78_15655 [Deltaproteobacteria bacterium]|nr:hypothetical protein [Deltaproteobacteria bacterium]
MAPEDFIDEYVLQLLEKVKGLRLAERLSPEDGRTLLEIEEEAEKRSLMGLGKVVNAGMRRVLAQNRLYAAVTTPEFAWCGSSLVLKKGDEVVGMETRDPELLAHYHRQDNTWFLHRNFVVFKDRIDFPGDIMKKICHFEIPEMTPEWCEAADRLAAILSLSIAVPAPPGDQYLKETIFPSATEQQAGTIVVGVRMALC